MFQNISYNVNGMKKDSAAWPHHILIPDINDNELITLQYNMELLQGDEFWRLRRRQDECWVHHFESEIKRQVTQYKYTFTLAPKYSAVI